MKAEDIALARLQSQQLVNTPFKTAREVVGHMGGMQAQDYAMAKWGIGIRMKNGTEQAVDDAIDKGEILRTHALRPTWHFVPAEDIYWMIELSKPRIRTQMRSRHKELGLTEAVLKKSNRTLLKAVESGSHLTREELVAELEAIKLVNSENRAAHLLFCAELDGILCSGASRKGKRTYALLESRVPKKKTLTREEALAKLAGTYFNSRGPATLADFTWWSGLTTTDAKKALEMIKKDLSEEVIDSVSYWISRSFKPTKQKENLVHLLPAFDEFVISYKDRTASIKTHLQKRTFSNNGIFWPTIMVNGKVLGLWKRSIKKESVMLETDLFEKPKQSIKTLLKQPAEAFGDFLGKKPEFL